jgi:hypothetical protein
MDDFEEFENNMLDKLILSGAVAVSGIDEETGEFLYQFTDKLKDISPAMYDEHISHINNLIMHFWQEGFFEINFEMDSPRVFLTEKAFDNSALSNLSKEDRWNIEEMKRIFIDKNSDIM